MVKRTHAHSLKIFGKSGQTRRLTSRSAGRETSLAYTFRIEYKQKTSEENIHMLLLCVTPCSERSSFRVFYLYLYINFHTSKSCARSLKRTPPQNSVTSSCKNSGKRFSPTSMTTNTHGEKKKGQRSALCNSLES